MSLYINTPVGMVNVGTAVQPLPDGWGAGWMSPPVYNATSIQGKTDICGLVCNVLGIGNRNYFSCIATGAYTVNVYADATATRLISTQNVATNTQANWSIDYAACTYQLDTTTRQAWVEIVPQSGQTLTMLRFNTNHPSETNVNSNPAILYFLARIPSCTVLSNFLPAQMVCAVDLYAPAATQGASLFLSSHLQSLKATINAVTNLSSAFSGCVVITDINLSMPACLSAFSLFTGCSSLRAAVLTNLGAMTGISSAFGTTAESTCLRSLRKLTLDSLHIGFTLQWTAMQAPELNALFTSLGTASGAQTIDVRNNPGSTTCDASIATAKGYTVLTA